VSTTEERRKEILETRQAHAKLAEILVEGTHYNEPVTVKTIDKKEHTVDVYALSEKGLVAAFEQAGANLKDIGDQEKIVSNLKLMGMLAAHAARQADLVGFLMPLESVKIALKALEISGFKGGAKTPKPD